DVQVTLQHLQLAREMMQQYRLDESQRLAAMREFHQAKAQARRVERAVGRLIRQQPARSGELLDGGWHMALKHGRVGREGLALDEWAQRAGLGKGEQQRLRQRHQRRQTGAAAPARTTGSLQQAARLLGVELDSSPEQIKRAYRRQLSRHHPDKLIGT